MTERLYYDDSYLTEFDARVLECIPDGEAYRVRLDRSAFYPTSGGQPYDTGSLGGAHVTDVNVVSGEVWHTLDAPLAEGEAVHGSIDWPRRFDHMQQHAGDHMIAGALHRLMHGVTIGLHVSTEISTIDVSMPDGATHIPEEDLRRIEWDVNEHIQRDVPIRSWFPDPEELAVLPLRKKPTVKEHVRVVAIGDDEMVACGGTHPSSAGQIGLVKILSATPARGKVRVAFLAGQRAFKDYVLCRSAAHAASDLFSTGVSNLESSIIALQDRLHKTEAELTRLRRAQLLGQADEMRQAAEVLPTGEKLVARFIEGDAFLLRELTSKLIEAPDMIVLMGVRQGSTANYIFGRSKNVDRDMGALLRQAARPLGGKGGGRPDFAQGGGVPEILDAACDILRG